MSELAGFKKDSYGRLVPIDGIKPLDLLRDDTVAKIVHSTGPVCAEKKAICHW